MLSLPSPGSARKFEYSAALRTHTPPPRRKDPLAEQYIDRIIDAVSALHEHPQLGRVVREAGQEHVRELIHQSHRIIYAVRTDRIQILAIIHGRRDLENFPNKPWDDD